MLFRFEVQGKEGKAHTYDTCINNPEVRSTPDFEPRVDNPSIFFGQHGTRTRVVKYRAHCFPCILGPLLIGLHGKTGDVLTDK